MPKQLKCARCGAVIKDKHHLIQHMEYLGQASPRLDICDSCNESFKYWLALCSIDDMYPSLMKDAYMHPTIKEVSDDY